MMKVFALDEKSPFVELLKNKSSNQNRIGENISDTNIEFKNENWGLALDEKIVTEKALENIGIEKNEINKISHISWDLSYGSGTHKITIPISGVVKNFVVTIKYYCHKNFFHR